ncbi:uncharacterized protein LOC127259778 [Andrographis paniculata]|uniref:uncharacterized protein LOC127259778 n=1 Tax=Andrographis paniculata TaxID=175694 RepID=UPI0021E948AB|nr:uncharacterized protein LOC127259778 [Andrographis paniculata]
MASAAGNRRRRHPPDGHFTQFVQNASTNLSSLFAPKPRSPPASSSKIHLPLLLPDRVLSLAASSDSAQPDSLSPTQPRDFPSSSADNSMPAAESGSRLPSTVRVTTGKGGGPAFVGQVYSMCDLSGTGLMAVSTHFNIPFLSKRTPEWLKKVFAAVTKSERTAPIFSFFMDVGDAVSYVKKLNIPSGVVGACRLDIAYEHFKEKPERFQFIPNGRQVKEANKLLKTLPHSNKKTKVQGVPVFSAQNLDIAIATKDGIKWYTPYFFDKNMLDNILEDSVDQHFHALIETRHFHRRRDAIDDSLTSETIEEMRDSMWDPPEVQEMLDEVGHSGIPLSIISKVAEIQLMHTVDKVILGNRWLRRATGIQPKFPYMVDSFEKKSAASLRRAKAPPHLISNSEFEDKAPVQNTAALSTAKTEDRALAKRSLLNFQFPFGDWLRLPWLKQQNTFFDSRDENSTNHQRGKRQESQPSPFLPKITMVGISTGEPGKMNKDALKKTMEGLTKELEKADRVERSVSPIGSESAAEERDPLFVANVGDYNSGAFKSGSTGWVRGSGSGSA